MIPIPRFPKGLGAMTDWRDIIDIVSRRWSLTKKA